MKTIRHLGAIAIGVLAVPSTVLADACKITDPSGYVLYLADNVTEEDCVEMADEVGELWVRWRCWPVYDNGGGLYDCYGPPNNCYCIISVPD